MPKADDPPSPETPMERFLRFGTALFAVKKDELPKREDRAKATGKRKKRPSSAA